MIRISLRLGALALPAALAGFAFTSRSMAQAADPSPSQDALAAKMVGAAHPEAKDRRLAPHDTFYLLSYVSATTDKGVEGFTPGQEVHLVEVHRPTRTLVVSDGHAQVEVPPSKLTNDMNIADLVRRNDEASQAQIATYLQAEEEAYAREQQKIALATARDLQKHREKEAAEQAREAELAQDNQSPPPVSASAGSGYYDQGGYGYGSPYSYFTGGDVVVTGVPMPAPITPSNTVAPATAAPGKIAAPPAGGGNGAKPR